MTESEMQVAIAREDLCRYLAACFYEPEAAFEEEGMFGALAEAANRVDEDLVPAAQRLGEQFRATKLNELLLDYTRLFIGPTEIQAKPYGSYWLEEAKTLMGDTTMAVLDLYREENFEMADEFKELPDHVAAELEFLYLLIFRENEARRLGDKVKLSAVLDLQKRFLAQHLGAWVSRFAEAVKAGARCDFYCVLAELTERFVKIQQGRV